jgi:hypothetical protein
MEQRTIRSVFVLKLIVLAFNVAACGSTSPTMPSPTRTTPSPTRGLVIGLQSLTVGPTVGRLVLHRDESATGTVTLNVIAPAGGAVVTLTVTGAESRALIVPASVTIPAGSSSATFPVSVTTSGVSGPTEVMLNAEYANTEQSFLIRLEPR